MRRSKLYDYTKEELQDILNSSSSYGEVLEKCKMSSHGSNRETLNKVISELNLDITLISKNRKIKNKEDLNKCRHYANVEDILKGEIKYKGNKLLKKLVAAGYKKYECEKCGISTWMGKKISLNLHHKDGDHENNQLSNLEVLCPNCHSLTDTYGSKNIKHINVISADEEDNSVILKGITEDGLRLYDGYEYYKVLCPSCGINYVYPEDKICKECDELKRCKPELTKEKLFSMIRKYKTFEECSKITGYPVIKLKKWFKYYAYNIA